MVIVLTRVPPHSAATSRVRPLGEAAGIDWGLMKLNAENRRDLLEVLEDRHGRRSTIATNQLPIEEWHARRDRRSDTR